MHIVQTSSAIRLALLCALAIAAPFSVPSPAIAGSSLQLQTLKTHSRISINLDPSVETEWKDTPGGFELKLKGVSIQDLYVGGSDLENLNDHRVTGLALEEAGSDVILRGKWKFDTGENALANPSMERFTFREKDPARFVIDFWPKAGVTKVIAERKKKEVERKASVDKAAADAKRRHDQRIAAEKAMAIESDVSRFCKEPLQEGVDVFLEFVPYHEPPNLSEYIPQGLPDEDYPFMQLETEPKESAKSEAKTVKLALELFAKRDYGLTVRTLDLFMRASPKSIYRVDMEFLRANAVLRLSMENPDKPELKKRVFQLFDEIREKNPGSPAALASAIFLAEKMRKDENDLQTIERYLWIATQYPKHKNVWAWRMLAAESLYRIKQTDRAVKEYEWIEENAPTPETRALASIRIGDAYLNRAQYDRALAAYFHANEKFPDAAAKAASVQINRGESLYWLGQYDRAQAQFENFVKNFPGHPAGWRAMLRLGEISGRKPGEVAAAESRARFLDTVNYYPFSPGAVIARMRLIPCGDHGGFDAKTADDFFKRETAKFDGKDEVRLDRFAEFRSMIRVRSMVLMNDPVAALEAAIAEKEDLSRKSPAYAWLKSMERKLFRKRVIELLDSGKKFEAVKFYDQYAARVDLTEELPEDITPDRLALADPEYLLRLSRVASELGLGRTAETISDRYQSEAKKLGLVGASGRSVASGSGNAVPQDLESRLKDSERAFTDAKALWMAASPDARKKNADEIRRKLERMTDESPFAYQKEIILGLMDESAKKWASALSHASKASMLLAKMTKEDSTERVGVDQWIARLQEAGGNTRAAIESYRKLQRSNAAADARTKAEGVGLPPIEGMEAWTLREGDLCGKLSKWGEAADAYGRAVNAGLGGNRAIYQYALSLEKIGGDDDKVSSLLKKVAESDQNDFWKELARKKLAGSNAMEGNSI